jgi:acetyl-CoA carboxylase carboxyl transferase subunit alpha
VADRVIILEYSTYAVISPEGCASILWKNSDKAEAAAEAMGLTSARLFEMKVVDEVIKEPLGGAHRDPDAIAESVRAALLRHLSELRKQGTAELIAARQQRLRTCGFVQ